MGRLHLSLCRRTIIAGLLSSILMLNLASSVVNAADSDPDITFDSDGKVLLPYSPANDHVADVAVYPDGRVLVAGFFDFSGTRRFGMARYNANGTADTTLNSTGLLGTTFSGSGDSATSVALQADGKFVVAGYHNTGTAQVMAVSRYSNTGVLDTSFSGDGKLLLEARTSAVDDWATDVMVQSDGKIVLVGRSYDGTKYQPAIVRLNVDGTVDFKQIINTSVEAVVTTGMLQPDGKILLGGFISTSGDNFAVWRYNTNGTADTTFGDSGLAVTDLTSTSNDAVYSLGLYADGRILAVGNTGYETTASNPALVRLTSNGSLDTTFSGDGKLLLSLSSGKDEFNKTALQNDGKIVAVGSAWNGVSSDVAAVRFTEAGDLDTSFSGDGVYTTSVGPASDVAYAIGIHANGKIVLAGDHFVSSGNNDWFTMQLEATSSLATLSSLTASGLTMAPSFSTSTRSYTASVANETTSISLTPTVTDSYSTVKVNGVTVTSGSASAAVSLAVGVNSIPVVVTAQDGVTQSTYTITVTRATAVGSSSGDTSSGTATTTLPTTTTVAAKAPPTVKVNKTITARTILKSRDIAWISTAKVVVTIKSTSKKYCSVTGIKVKGVKKGNCTVVIAVTPKATTKVPKPKTTKTTVTIRVI